MKTVSMAALAALALSGCANPYPPHQGRYGPPADGCAAPCTGPGPGMGMGAGMGPAMGPGAMGGPPTPPAQVSASVAQLPSGYQKAAAPAGASVYFVNLRNGMVVNNPVRVVFGLSGMGVAPAGVDKPGTGHHHLLVDVAAWDANAPLPANDQHRHFGMGQTEVTLTLPPGPHTLQLVLGDQNHIAHHPPVMSERITVQVR